MKFMRSKATIIFIAVISALCMVAALIAIDISLLMIRKKDQAIKPVPVEQNEEVQASAKLVKTKKLEEHVLYFNGQPVEGLTAFMSTEDTCLIPLDMLLEKLGVESRYFAPDDILEFVLNNKKVTVRINQSEVVVGGQKIRLKAAVQAARNHILAPVELLENMDGFGVLTGSDKESLFVNYFPDVNKYAQKLRVMKTFNGIASISDFLQPSYFWRSRDEVVGDDRILPSYDESSYVIKALNKVFLISDGQKQKPREIEVDPSASWSADGKYLYWIDKSKGLSYSYTIATGMETELGDYYQRVLADRRESNTAAVYGNGGVLYDYDQGRRYKRVVLTDPQHFSNYTFIERRGRTFIEGPVSFSPNGESILFYESGQGYYSANADGTGKKLVGEGKGATWINNDKIMLSGKDGMYVVSKDGTNASNIAQAWRRLGETPKGHVLYARGNVLYGETDGKDVKLLTLPIHCDYIFANDISGPYVAVSKEQDKVYLIAGGIVDELGSSSHLMKGRGINMENPWGSSILGSPEGELTAVAQKAEGLLSIDIIDNKKGDMRSLTLNAPAEEQEERFNMKWINDGALIVHTSKSAWLIELEDEAEIYHWTEEEAYRIEGILLK